MLKIRYVPNGLSVGRIAAALLLCFMDEQPAFSICYLLCGVTDILDGYIARRYHVQSTLGAKLDSLGDLVFWLVVLVLLFLRTGIFTHWVLAGMTLVACIRLLNFVITKVKFGQWGMLHTLGNKITGLALFLLCFVAFLFDTIEWYVWGIVFGLALPSSIEETAILLRSTCYEPNPKGFFDTAT